MMLFTTMLFTTMSPCSVMRLFTTMLFTTMGDGERRRSQVLLADLIERGLKPDMHACSSLTRPRHRAELCATPLVVLR
jgi:hypothetical protein